MCVGVRSSPSDLRLGIVTNDENLISKTAFYFQFNLFSINLASDMLSK